MFMRGVKRVDIVESAAPNTQISEWDADIDGADVWWRQKDMFFPETLRYEFEMVEGDFQKYSGVWAVTHEAQNKSRISFSAVIEWGIPKMEPYVANALNEKAAKSVKSMIWLIRFQANQIIENG